MKGFVQDPRYGVRMLTRNPGLTAVAVEILGRELAGILVLDCFAAYDPHALAQRLNQRCLGHILKDLSEIEREEEGGAVRFGSAVFWTARALQQPRPAPSEAGFNAAAAAIEARLGELIDEKRRLTDPDNGRLARRLRKQRAHLLGFLYVDGLDATNDHGGQMLRPAVITRKPSGRNRTDGGSRTHSMLASILVACRHQALSLIDSLVKVQRAAGGGMPSLAPPPPFDTS